MTMDNEYTSDSYVALSVKNFTSGAQLRVAQRKDHPKPRRRGIPTSSIMMFRWWGSSCEQSEKVGGKNNPPLTPSRAP